VRLTIGEQGQLVRRDGTVVGRLTSITADFDMEALGVGGENIEKSTTEQQPPAPGEQTALVPNPTTEVWQHYQRTVAGADRRSFDSARQTCVRRALKVRTVDQCRQAIDSLAASDWHNGNNPDRKRYLDIQYALGQKNESADARIDKMIARSSEAAPLPANGVLSVDELIQRFPEQHQARVRPEIIDPINAMLADPDDADLKLNGQRQLRRMRDFGFDVLVENSVITGARVVR